MFYDKTKRKWGMYEKPKSPRTRMIQFVGCRNVRFFDITFKDSPGWTCWMRMCENLEIERVKVHADQLMINNDGFHIDGCKHVRIRNCDLRTGDDCIIMRSIQSPNGDSALCEDMIVEDCSLSSSCQAVRLGCPSDGTIRNGIFRRLKMRGGNGIISVNPVRYLQDNDHGDLKMENILFEDCDIDVKYSPIIFLVESGIKLRSFGNTTFKNIKLKGKKPIRLEGNAFTYLENLCFENVKGEIDNVEAITTRAVKNIRFDRFEVTSSKPTDEKLSVNTSDGWERVR
jgi:polygalacturonase